MKLTIFGASGYSGKEILKQALAQGHQVIAFTRTKESITTTHPNLTVMEGSVLDASAVNKAIRNQDAVIQCLGIGGKGYGKPNPIVSEATKVIVGEMGKENVSRLIAMSNVGAGNSMVAQSWVFKKIILPYFMKWLQIIIEDKNVMEPMIMNTNLNWTIVRCPNIVDKPAKQKITTSLDGKNLKLSITKADMATFIVDQLKTNEFSKQAPCISN
jgi:putative NADH-flavin reductase